MLEAEFETIVDSDELRAHADYLREIALPCVDIAAADGEPQPGDSRFGGLPFAPEHFAWPEHAHPDAVYRFAAQFNLAELEEPVGGLPSAGLLSLFYAYDDDGEVFWQDEGFVLAFHWQSTDGFVLHSTDHQPDGVRGVELRSGLDLPRFAVLREDWPFDEELQDWLFYEALADTGADRLLGYPRFTSLAYDPAPGPDWTSLLTLRSRDELDWNFHDDGMLMVFIERSRLAKGDFENLQSDAG